MSNLNQLNVLLVQPDPEICGALAFGLESQYGAAVVEAESAELAQALLTQVSQLDLLILSDTPEDRALLSMLEAGDERPDTILCVEDKLSDPGLLTQPGVIGIARREELIKDVLALIGSHHYNGEVRAGLQPSEFCRVSADLLLRITPLAADIYIQLSEEKHLKIFYQGDRFSAEDFEKFTVKRRVKYFYVRREDSERFLARLQERVHNVLNREPLDLEALYSMSAGIHESVHDLMINAGVTDEVRQMTETNVRLVMKSVSDNSDFAEALRRFQSEPEKYISQHSLLLSEIACNFAGMMGWVSDSTFQKLVYAALFHDISLKSHEMARAASLNEIMSLKEVVLLESIELVTNHPVISAEFFRQLKESNPDTETMIRHHHERPDGTGFPAGINHSKFTPLSCLFVIAHDFVDYMLANPGMEPSRVLLAFLSEHEDLYAHGVFRQTHRALKAKTR